MSIISELTPGTGVQVQYKNRAHQDCRIAMVYVGMIEKEYLLLRWPSQANPQDNINDLYAGAQLTCKGVVKKDSLLAVNFSASSLGIKVLKEPLLLLSYPVNVKSQTLRHKPRLAVELMANIRLVSESSDHLALISDFSLSGLRCEYIPTDEEVTEYQTKGVSHLVGQEVEITFVTEDELGDELTIHGEIKNIQAREKITVGLQFLTEDLSVIKSIFAIVLMRSHGM